MGTQTMTVGLMADPGLPEKTARSVADSLSRDLQRNTDAGSGWEVEVSQAALPLTRDGEIPLLDHAEALRDHHGWD